MPVQTQLQQRRGTAASWTSTNPTLAAGEIGFETDTGKFKIGNGSTAWAALAYSAGATAVTYLFNATSGQTTFSGADANGLTLAYTVGAEQVYLNGVLQVRGSDYTATNGTSIVLASGALTSDVLNVIAYSAMTITDTYTQAQADAKFVQQTNNYFAGKNKIINGDFGIWQRGTSFASNQYTADRFASETDGNGTVTVTRQTFTPGTAPASPYEATYFLQSAVSVVGTSTYHRLYQRIEDVRTFAGQPVTLSFWARLDSGTVGSAYFRLNQNFGSGGSAAVNGAANSITLTSSWQRFTATVTPGSMSGKTIGTNSYVTFDLVIPFTATNTVQVWGFQAEAGSIATPFQTATGTLAGELAACQRYYWRTSYDSTYTHLGSGIANTTTALKLIVPLPVQLRTVPSSFDWAGSGGLMATDGVNNLFITAIAGDGGYTSRNIIYLNCTFSGATQFRSYQVALGGAGNTTQYLGCSAEL